MLILPCQLAAGHSGAHIYPIKQSSFDVQDNTLLAKTWSKRAWSKSARNILSNCVNMHASVNMFVSTGMDFLLKRYHSLGFHLSLPVGIFLSVNIVHICLCLKLISVTIMTYFHMVVFFRINYMLYYLFISLHQ